MALKIFNYVTLEVQDCFGVEVSGEGSNELPRTQENLAYRAVCLLHETIGRPTPPLLLRLENHIPLARGLGSSAAATVGALVAANELNGRLLSPLQLIRLANRLEGHVDNAAASLLGGAVLSLVEGDELVFAAIKVPAALRAVVFVPSFQMPTKEARAVLPQQVTREDAVHNAARVGLLVVALTSGRLELLRTATQDRLHQPYRQKLFPEMYAMFSAAREAGALGAFLSGAGSTILALTHEDPSPVARAVEDTAGRLGVTGRTIVTGVSQYGARVISSRGQEEA
jgi:homoserine kinase